MVCWLSTSTSRSATPPSGLPSYVSSPRRAVFCRLRAWPAHPGRRMAGLRTRSMASQAQVVARRRLKTSPTNPAQLSAPQALPHQPSPLLRALRFKTSLASTARPSSFSPRVASPPRPPSEHWLTHGDTSRSLASPHASSPPRSPGLSHRPSPAPRVRRMP